MKEKEEEISLLLDALSKYGRHTIECGSIIVFPRIANVDYVCNCGWDEIKARYLIKEKS